MITPKFIIHYNENKFFNQNIYTSSTSGDKPLKAASWCDGKKLHLAVIPQFKRYKRVGRFFWKNLEAKPLSVELHRFDSKNHHAKSRMADLHDLNDRFTRFGRENLPTLSGQETPHNRGMTPCHHFLLTIFISYNIFMK